MYVTSGPTRRWIINRTRRRRRWWWKSLSPLPSSCRRRWRRHRLRRRNLSLTTNCSSPHYSLRPQITGSWRGRRLGVRIAVGTQVDGLMKEKDKETLFTGVLAGKTRSEAGSTLIYRWHIGRQIVRSAAYFSPFGPAISGDLLRGVGRRIVLYIWLFTRYYENVEYIAGNEIGPFRLQLCHSWGDLCSSQAINLVGLIY